MFHPSASLYNLKAVSFVVGMEPTRRTLFYIRIEFMTSTSVTASGGGFHQKTEPLCTALQLGRSRWWIDAEVFQTLPTDGHLKKRSVHPGRGKALAVLSMIPVLTYTLTMVFYHRQL